MNARTYVALLRGINVGGRNKLLMADLRTLATGLGWLDVRTYIQSGNMVFRAKDKPEKLEHELENAIARHHTLSVAVIVRDTRDWTRYILTNPFAQVPDSATSVAMLALSKEPPKEGAAQELNARATLGEQARQIDDAIWIHYPEGAGRSKLSPGLLDRVIGSPVTTRNWRTVKELGTMAGIEPTA